MLTVTTTCCRWLCIEPAEVVQSKAIWMEGEWIQAEQRASKAEHGFWVGLSTGGQKPGDMPIAGRVSMSYGLRIRDETRH